MLAVSTCQRSITKHMICPSWNFSIGRAIANLSISYYRFAASLKKITLGLSRCIPCLKEIFCPSWTTNFASSPPLKSRTLTCNLPNISKTLWIAVNHIGETSNRIIVYAKIIASRFWSLFTAFQVSKIIIPAKQLILPQRTGVFSKPHFNSGSFYLILILVCCS